MKIALIGPPQSGKSTLFAAVTGRPADPTLAMQEQAAVIKVPDERLTYLTELHKPEKTIEAALEILDFPSISSSDDSGRQQFKKHLPQIRLCDVLVAVVRDFANDAVVAHKERIDPKADLSDLYEDFIFGDLEAVMNRIERLEKSRKKPTKTRDQEERELSLLQRCQEALEELQPLSAVLKHADEAVLLRSFAFLTEKPLVAVVNVSEDQAGNAPSVQGEHTSSVINICAETEAQIAGLEPEDRAEFLSDLGISSPAHDCLIQICYQTAGLVTFLTTGSDEVRAWPIRKGTSAVEAAGKIHSDIARGFIRAETVAYDDLFAADGDLKAVKAAGKIRLEGKTYVVQDGDIINFKFNV